MAYNEQTAQRIREILLEKKADFTEKPMFGGLCFLVDDKMCCATRIDKETDEDIMLCRVGEKNYKAALKKPNVIPMEFTGRSMKGYIYVTAKGIKKENDLAYWIQECLNYNPEAKSSKKK